MRSHIIGSFDIWMAHNVNGEWQAPIHLGPGIDPAVGPNINTSAWELAKICAAPSYLTARNSMVAGDRRAATIMT